MMGFQDESGVVQALGQAEELLSQRPHRLVVAARIIHPPESPQDTEELHRFS